MKIDLYQQSGEKSGSVEVSDKIFAAPVNEELMRLVLMRQLANARQPNANTKTRGEVRGGGHKPIKQKHTGKARQGSTRSPVWPGGGIAFGPRSNRNFTLKITRSAARSALFSGLSQKASEKTLFAMDKYEAKTPKTSAFASLLKKLPVTRSLLVVMSDKDANLEKSVRNLPNVKAVLVDYLNLHDLSKYTNVMFMASAIKKAEALFLKK
ncbi:50S ribosomal protein L4 [Candidatus Peregrinibacteria bacterium]|nr:50S ribosomal protein L4 [Candidatus Peregrinibacteria bacterium]